MTQHGSGGLDLVVTGKLPPSSRIKRRPGTGSRVRQNKLFSMKQEPVTVRPQSVPVVPQQPLWDENSPLAVQSSPVSLSTRSTSSSSSLSKHIHRAVSIATPHTTPSHTSLPRRATRTPPPPNAGRYGQPRERLGGRSASHNMVSVPLSLRQRQGLGNGMEGETCCPNDLSDSIDHMSSEMDNILMGLRNGLYTSSEEHDQQQCVNRVSSAPVVMSITSVEEKEEEEKKEEEEEKEEETWSNHFHESDEEKEEELLEKKKQEVAAARRLQRWYRRERERKQKALVQSLLEEKREELNHSREEREKQALNEVTSRERDEADKQQRRAARMQAARKQAIESLKRKREEKRLTAEMVVQQEMAFLEASGKVKKASTAHNTKRRPKIAANLGVSDSSPPEVANSDTTKPLTATQSSPDPGEGDGSAEKSEIQPVHENRSSPTGLLEEFFQAGPRKLPAHSPVRKPSPALTKPSTIDNIMQTLQQLEEAPPPLPGPPATPTPTHSSVSYLSATNLHKMRDYLNPEQNHNGLSNSKLHTILSYLDQVDRRDEEPAPQQETERGDVQLTQQMQAASVVASDVTSTIMTQRLDIENKKKTIEMLQKALTHQRELTVYHTKEMEKDAQKRLELQRQEYETTVQRHQSFIDQLIEDKKVLGDKCEQLVKELRETNNKYKTKIKSMEEAHAAVMEKQRQTAAASDKLKRERWKADETRRIKEATVKSLEPEIQRIIARGKAEIQKLKALHEGELLQADERASRKFLQQTEELRTQLAQEKELACTHERELARQKYEQLAEQEEKSYQQLRRKLYAELQQERDKAVEETRSQQQMMEGRLQEMRESHVALVENMKAEHESAVAEIQRRHQSEIREVGERATIERTAWEEHYMKRQEAVLLAREREMREQLRRERDAEIETVIQRLEHETAITKEECEKAAESRIRRIREKCETELREVEKSERSTLQKFNEMKYQLTEREGDVTRLRTQLRRREQEVEEVNEVASRLSKERDRVTDIVRQEFADRLIATEEDSRQVKIEMSELKARHKSELERMSRAKERELEEVHERVKQALAKKEGNLKSLRAQHEAALKRADHLEMLLEQQRKELLNR